MEEVRQSNLCTEFENIVRNSKNNFQLELLSCESRRSNPPPLLRWYLGDRELRSAHDQTNSTEEDDARRWKSVSTLQHKFAKEDYGKTLACRVEHPAYPAGQQTATVTLDVLCEYETYLFDDLNKYEMVFFPFIRENVL